MADEKGKLDLGLASRVDAKKRWDAFRAVAGGWWPPHELAVRLGYLWRIFAYAGRPEPVAEQRRLV